MPAAPAQPAMINNTSGWRLAFFLWVFAVAGRRDGWAGQGRGWPGWLARLPLLLSTCYVQTTAGGGPAPLTARLDTNANTQMGKLIIGGLMALLCLLFPKQLLPMLFSLIYLCINLDSWNLFVRAAKCLVHGSRFYYRR